MAETVSHKTKESVILFEMRLNHNLNFFINDGKLIFEVDKQSIIISEFSIFPDLEITKLSALAEYREGNETAILSAIERIKTNIAIKEMSALEKTSDTQPKAEQASEPEEIKLTENQKINNIKDAEFNVITNRLNISKQVTLEKRQKTFSIDFNSREISGFINYVESKKIKIFINGEEIKPKHEIEFLKRVFPYISVEITLK